MNGAAVALTRTEFALLDTISANPGMVFSRHQRFDLVWGEGWWGDNHLVDVHIANLRKKLTTAGAGEIIRTVRGIGYGVVR